MLSFARGVALVALALSLIACATGPLLKANHIDGDLRGMLYDLDRQPLENATIEAIYGAKSTSGVTDLHGRFGLGTIPFGPVTLNVTKAGYEPLRWELTFLEGSQVLYLQVASSDQLFERAALALEKKDWREFDGYLARGRFLAPESMQGVMLEATGWELQGDLRRATAVLEPGAKGTTNAALLIFLGDLLEKTGSDVAAVDAWTRALQIREDSSVRNRIEKVLRK